MKWSELTWKERKQIYDAVRADNPNASYLDIKQQFDNIPEYENGKSRWLNDAAYRDSIHTARLKYKVDSDARRKNFKSPSLEEIQNSNFIRKDSTNNKHILEGLSYFNQLLPNIPTSNQIENVIDAQKEERIERVKPIKDFAKIGGLLGQMALGGGAIAAKNAGNLMLSRVLQGTAALWDGVETIQAIKDDDTLGIIQNVIPVISQGVTGLRYLPKLQHRNSTILDGASNLGPIWDISVNPIIEYLKTEENVDKHNSPAYENGKDIINFVNKSDANFVYRLKTPFRNTIDDWETQYISPYIGKPSMRGDWKYKSISTHKMVYGEPYGEPVVWPLVQEVNGKLIDFTRPPYHPWAALDNAEQTGDYIKFPTTDSAKWFTENYKNYYPSFENGKEGNPKLPVELGLTPGTPEYFARQQRISGRADVVQPEAHLTPAGVIKDAISFGENVKEGNYTDAAVDAALTLIPVGVRKAAKHLFKTSEVPARVDRESRSVKKKTEADYDSEFSEVLRRNRNIKEYEKEISQSINTAISSNPKVRKLYSDVDAEYGTDYTDAIKRIAMRDMTNRGKYVKYAELPDGIQGHTAGRNIDPEIGPTINNFTITLDPLQYIPGTANHELGHVADQLAGDATKNGYLDYLLDEFNVMDRKELLDKGIRISPQHQMYLFDPLEAKSHMQHLKRSMIQQGKLTDWTDPLTQDKIEAFLFDPRNNVNGMNKIQYNMYRDKSRFVDRMNHLIPVEYAVPLGISGFVNYNTDNNN